VPVAREVVGGAGEVQVEVAVVAAVARASAAAAAAVAGEVAALVADERARVAVVVDHDRYVLLFPFSLLLCADRGLGCCCLGILPTEPYIDRRGNMPCHQPHSVHGIICTGGMAQTRFELSNVQLGLRAYTQ
jgi:hypothetical protein